MNFVRNSSPDFRFMANDRIVNRYTGWKVISCSQFSDGSGGSGAVLKLKGIKMLEGVEIELAYLTYPGLPVIGKKITFINRSYSDLKLEAVDIENLNLNTDYVSTWV